MKETKPFSLRTVTALGFLLGASAAVFSLSMKGLAQVSRTPPSTDPSASGAFQKCIDQALEETATPDLMAPGGMRDPIKVCLREFGVAPQSPSHRGVSPDAPPLDGGGTGAPESGSVVDRGAPV